MNALNERHLSAYPGSIVHISEHFFELRFPMDERALEIAAEVTREVTGEVGRLLRALSGEMSRQPIQSELGLKAEEHFRTAYLKPALERTMIEMTIPDKPQSRLQKYRLTSAGRKWLNIAGSEK